jgi:hypothetical protein
MELRTHRVIVAPIVTRLSVYAGYDGWRLPVGNAGRDCLGLVHQSIPPVGNGGRHPAFEILLGK